MRFSVTILLIMLCQLLAAQKETIRMQIKRIGENHYRAKINNESDSIICLRVSPGIDLKDFNIDSAVKLEPIRLDSNKTVYYSIMILDIPGIIIERPSPKPLVVLPYLSKEFDFSVKELQNGKSKIFQLDYYTINEYDYKKFNKDIDNFERHRNYLKKTVYKEF